MGMRSIAHLNALRAFEASARHQSFSLAAQELNVTPAAVGQLVRTLEDWLGSPLFVRSTSGRARLVTTKWPSRPCLTFVRGWSVWPWGWSACAVAARAACSR